MTVNTELSKRIYTGNGVATDYDYNFKIPLASDLSVSLFDLDGVELPQVLNTDYEVTGAGGDNGGKVMFTVPPPSGYTILLLSDASYTQPTDFKNQGRFFPEAHENAIDRAVILARQNHEAITRSITLPPQVSGVSTQLPVPQVSTLFGWNGDGSAIENFPLATIATQIAYGDKNYQVFAGTGAQVNFTLSQNPGSLGNLDVSIDGVTQVPVADYTLSVTTLTFSTAPNNGAVILVRFDIAVPIGSSLASSSQFTQSGTGAIVRTVQDRLRDTINVKDFGALGNDIADDTLAIQRAIDATPAYGELFFPTGRYRLTSQVSFGDKCITLTGAGFLNTIIRCIGTTGLRISNTGTPPLDESYTVTVRDIWFMTDNQSDASTVKAIHYSQPAPGGDGGQAQMSLLVQNCYFSGIFKFDQWWPFAIYVENAPNTLIDRCFYQGQANITKGDAFYAAGKSDVFVVRDSQIIFCHSGVTQESNSLDNFGSEGLIVRNTGIDDCDYGVRKLHQNASGIGEPLLEVIGCQISTRGIGIYSVNAYDISIHDCLIYLQGTALEAIDANPYGVRLDKTIGATMTKFTVAQCGVSLLDNPSGTGTGIYTAVGEGQIALNRFYNFDGPAVTVDAANVYVARSNSFELCPTTVSNLSGGAVTDQNTVPMPGSGFPTDDGLWTPPYGSEVLTNGYFDSSTGWTIGAGWSITGGNAVHVTPTGGTLTRSVSVIAGVRYRIEVAFRQWTAGGATVGFTGGTDVLENLPSQGGTHVIYATAATGNSAFAIVAGGGFDASISSVSVRAVRS